MAKGKHTRALFEVIKQSQEQQARRANGPRRSAAATGGWFGWLKRATTLDAKPVRQRSKKSVEPVMREIPVQPPTDPTPNLNASDDHPLAPPVHRAMRGHDQDTFIAEERAPTDSPPEVVENARDDSAGWPHLSDSDQNVRWNEDASTEVTEATASPDIQADEAVQPAESPVRAASSPHWMDQAEDDDHAPEASPHDTAITTALRDEDEPRQLRRSGGAMQSLQMSISYPTMAITAVALLMLLTVAFLAGRNTAPRVALSGPTLEQLQQGKPSPDVLNLKNTPPETTLSQGADAKPPVPTRVQPPSEPAVQSNAATPAPDRRRVGGRNYIIAQSYPDPDNAEKAADLLRKNNIPVTVEQLDAAPGWFCVVTEVGFDRVSSPDCERYQKLVKDLSAAAKTARLKSFEPYLYKWK